MKYLGILFLILITSCKNESSITERQREDFKNLTKEYQTKYMDGSDNCEYILNALDENIKMSESQFGQPVMDISYDQLKYHQKRVGVVKEFTFDAAHHLHAYDGKCKSLHGHTYRLVIHFSGMVNEIGIVVDFGDIKRVFKEKIDAKLDHQYLNEVLPPMTTTAENMIVWIWEQLEEALLEIKNPSLRMEELTLYETPTSYAYLKREWMEA